MYVEFLISMFAAYLLDMVFADPFNIPHPVVYMGKLISFLEKRIRKPGDSEKTQFLKGCMASLIVIAACALPGILIMYIKIKAIRMALMIIVFFFCLAGETLKREALSVNKALGISLTEGRKRISRIVGRDPMSLDKDGIIRACIETVAENTSDGITAPMFWGLLLGPMGSLVYKGINTMDSMTGYRNERYEFYGKSAAIEDDIVNIIPARITSLTAVLLSPAVGGRIRNTMGIYLADSKNHRSPNSGHPESAFAGALGIRLGGPASYGGIREERPYINGEGKKPSEADIIRAVKLMEWITPSFLMISGIFIIIFNRIF